MNDPCNCWEPSHIGDMTGAHYCKHCGAKKKRGWVADHKESAVEYAAKETMKQYWAMRAEQRVVDSNTVDCTRVDCAWHDPKRERNCFRDPGDCRYIV